jgi:heat shock protein HtpX
MASAATVSFEIDTEITPAYFDDLLTFFYQQYIVPRAERFANVNRTVIDDEPVLSFAVLGSPERGHIDVEIRAGRPINVRIVPSDPTSPQAAIDQLKEDVVIGVKLYEERIRRTTLYFAWVVGAEVIPEKSPQGERNIIYRLFSESMLLFFIIFTAASIFLFIILGPYAPIALVAFQFAMVLFSDRIFARMGDWSVTESDKNVHLFEYHMSVEEFRDFRKRFPKDAVLRMKKAIYEKTFAVGKPMDCASVQEVLSAYGFECRPGNMLVKTVNVYDIVKRASETFGLPIPKIVISNTILPNAAASGPSPSHGVVLITTGLLVQLEEEEVYNVVGHEFSHLRGRDPLALFGLTAAEYLLRVYVLWPFLYFFGFLYLFFALGVVYFIAKFFESRADLDAAIKMGEPKVLAGALRKIGYRRLQFERMPAYKIQEWIGWDPHPPIYFRVARLEKLESPEKIRSPLLRSIGDNIRGFFAALH